VYGTERKPLFGHVKAAKYWSAKDSTESSTNVLNVSHQ